MADEYMRIPEEQYNKFKFQARGQYMAILNVFRCYGMEKDVDVAIEECMKVCENFSMATRGKKKPIHILNKPKARATE